MSPEDAPVNSNINRDGTSSSNFLHSSPVNLWRAMLSLEYLLETETLPRHSTPSATSRGRVEPFHSA